jgi:integrase
MSPRLKGGELRGAGRTFFKPLLKTCLFTFQRPGEVRAMRWADIDWGRRLWMPHITKTDVAHAVPLSDQMIVLLREMEQITGEQKFVFALSQKPISDVATNQMIKKLGWQGRVTAHGFRATARTVLAERLSFEPRHIELQLAHAVPETHGGAYNRALHLAERTAMMQAWADWLDQVRTGESAEHKVVHLKP